MHRRGQLPRKKLYAFLIVVIYITSLSTRLQFQSPFSHLVLCVNPCIISMAPQPSNSKRIAEAQSLAKSDPSKAESIYKDVLSKGPSTGEAALRDYETALMGLGELYRDEKKPSELSGLVTNSRSTLSSFAKAKTAKIGKYSCVRTLWEYLTSSSPPAARPPLRDTEYR